ncbi:MAG: hypothetical protein MUF00_09405 [Gemmatimonadaceae bacterium]|jgi:hypothetical protein|nr:hypothetical protein [Gemmatimonadaceae bacterium]
MTPYAARIAEIERAPTQPRPVTVTVSTIVAVAHDCVLSWFVQRSPIGLFNGWGPIPGVAAVEEQSGPWLVAGSHRRLRLSDGHVVTEAVVQCELPVRFRYRMTGFAVPLHAMVEAIDGDWHCEPTGTSATRIAWTYRMRPRHAAWIPVLWVMTHTAWRTYMRRNIRLVARAAERELV